MKKILKIIGAILLAILLIFIIWKIVTYKEKPFKKFTFKTYNHVFNTTKISYLDTIVHSGLQSLKIDSVIVVIEPLINNEKLLPGDLDTKAYIKGEKYSYLIFIGNFSRTDNILTLSHELIHLKQYYNNELIINGNMQIWKGDTINISNISYEKRPWEIDAFSKQKQLELDMIKILY
jgi:hypothetical protein